MFRISIVLLLAAKLAAQKLIQSDTDITCPILGQVFPPPYEIASQSLWADAATKLTGKLTSATFLNGSSFAVQIISRRNDQPLYEYYHTAPGHKYGSNGTKPVDSDTVFRIGSTSKLLTVYALLLQCGFKCWEDPITKYVPELRNTSNGITYEEITLGTLASHQSGIGRDCKPS
jgi:CubicO group peptidase (beta-lactamase class C family)